jgi:hypothetical protein
MGKRKTHGIGSAVTLIAACAILQAQTSAVPVAKDWGQPVDGLQISLYLASDKTDHLGVPDVACEYIGRLGDSHQR